LNYTRKMWQGVYTQKKQFTTCVKSFIPSLFAAGEMYELSSSYLYLD